MKILFVNLTLEFKGGVKHPKHTVAPLDIGYCASLLDRESNSTELIDTAVKKYSYSTLVSDIKKEKPDILVIKPFITLRESALRIAEDLKKNIKNIFLIGPFPTLCYEQLVFKKSPISACILNEPEYTLLEIIIKIKKKESIKNIKGIVYYDEKLIKTAERGFIKNLDEIPFPKHEFLINKGYRFYYPVNIKRKLRIGYVLSSRGCPYDCIFCSPIERASYGKVYRQRSAKNVVAEMEFLKNKGINVIYFIDDLFLLNDKRANDICGEIIQRNLKIKWVVQSRVDTINFSILKKLKEAGCSTIAIGIESGENRVLNSLNKQINTDQIRGIINKIHGIGILNVGSFIIGSPYDTKNTIIKTTEFAKSLPFDMVEMLFFTPYPGSIAYKKCKAKLDNYTKFCVYDKINGVDKGGLVKLQKYFYKSYYLRPKFILRYLYKNFIFLVLNFRQQVKLIKKTFKYLFSY